MEEPAGSANASQAEKNLGITVLNGKIKSQRKSFGMLFNERKNETDPEKRGAIQEKIDVLLKDIQKAHDEIREIKAAGV